MADQDALKFEEDLIKERIEGEQLLLALGEFDGPIDMLLSLARDQKVDLSKISILALATQYLDFVEKAQKLRLELAADYLVMAAWLAYLKSRMLIPQEDKKSAEPSAQDMADALQFQLRRLEAMRKVSNDLFNLPRLGFNVFVRGEPDGLKTEYIPKYDMTLYDLLKSYGDIKQRQKNSVYQLKAVRLFSLEEAISRMENMFGKLPQEWVSLFMFLPSGLNEPIVKRSAVASTFGASLEMAKRGLIQISQEKNYAPIFIRKPVANGNGEAPPVVSYDTPIEGPVDIPFDDAVEVAEVEIEETAVVVEAEVDLVSEAFVEEVEVSLVEDAVTEEYATVEEVVDVVEEQSPAAELDEDALWEQMLREEAEEKAKAEAAK